MSDSTSGLYEWLRRMATGGGPAAQHPFMKARGFGVGAGPGQEYASPFVPQLPTKPFSTSMGDVTPTGLSSPRPPAAVTADPQNKLEPRAPLQFAWMGNDPQDYRSGQTDILKMSGAPSAREGFMGQAPVAGGQKSGGFGPSQNDWSKVANPMGFEAFGERPMVDAINKTAEDPLWREKGEAEIEATRDVGIARGIAQFQETQQKRLRDEQADAYASMAVAQERAKRRQDGAPPLTPDEEAEVKDIARNTFLSGRMI